VYALHGGFVVLLRLWEWQKHEAGWWGVWVGADGQPRRPPVELGMADMDIAVARAVDGQTLALVLRPAAIAPGRDPLPGRWQTIRAGDDGGLRSIATAVLVDDLVTTTEDSWEPARLRGEAGWVVLRSGARRPAGVFGGKRMRAEDAVLERAGEDIDFAVQ